MVACRSSDEELCSEIPLRSSYPSNMSHPEVQTNFQVPFHFMKLLLAKKAFSGQHSEPFCLNADRYKPCEVIESIIIFTKNQG